MQEINFKKLGKKSKKKKKKATPYGQPTFVAHIGEAKQLAKVDMKKQFGMAHKSVIDQMTAIQSLGNVPDIPDTELDIALAPPVVEIKPIKNLKTIDSWDITGILPEERDIMSIPPAPPIPPTLQDRVIKIPNFRTTFSTNFPFVSIISV